MTNPQPNPESAVPRLEFPSGSQRGHAQGTAHVTLEEVLEAGTQNLKLSLDITGEENLDFEALYDVVEATKVRLAADHDGSDVDGNPVASEREGGSGVVANEMQCLVSLLEAGTQTPNLQDDAQAALERASIILHESHQAIGFDTQRYGKAVDVMLRSADTVDVERFARSAVVDMSASLTHHTFDAWMPAILLTARRASPSLCDWLAGIAANGSVHAQEALWPYVVDELLVSLKDRQEAAPGIVYALDGLSLDLAIERLAKLPSIHRSVLAPGMFSLRQTSLHHLLIRLMDGPARYVVGPVLLAAFRETLPTDAGISFCLFASRQYDDSIGWLLTEQLKNLDQPVHVDVQRTAAWTLLSALEQLPPERRNEVWIPGALEWLGSRDMSMDADVQVDSTRGILQRIVSERRSLRKVWSRDCRRAAAQALTNEGLS
ncbi:MAG: hypothetical protein AAGG01_17705 [Planctomycetota bacterium]